MNDGRRLAALMFTDMVGYSAIAHDDEVIARELVDEHRKIVRHAVENHHGREHQTTGDGFFIEFASAIEAVECSVEIQSRLRDRDRHLPIERRAKVRIGIHLGDIVSSGKDLYGNGVNLAARIEPLAPAGGICITRQIFDQVNGKVAGTQFRKMGHRRLKNIASGAEVYQALLPWEIAAGQKRVFFPRLGLIRATFRNLNGAVATCLFAGCLALLFVATSKSLFPSGNRETPSRAIATAAKSSAERVGLATDWMYQVPENQVAPLRNQEPREDSWRPFDPKNSWKYSEIIRGRYWLKKTFKTQSEFRNPAAVLGVISDSHRVYLNGIFVGGSDHLSDLAFYPFDSRLLSTEEDNTLLIQAETRSSLNPGLALLPGTGAFLDEFSAVRRAVVENQIRFHLARSIYFSLSILIFAVAFIYALFRKSSKSYFYYAFVLLLGTLHLAYYSPWISGEFDYPFVRLLKVLGLTLVPFVLFSSYLSSEKRARFELFNNLAAAFFATIAAIVLLYYSVDTLSFTQNFNRFIIGAAIYTSVVVVLHLVRSAIQRRMNVISCFHFSFEVLSLVALIGSVKLGLTGGLISHGVREAMNTVSLAIPFLFALVIMLVATIDYIRQSHAAKNQKARENLALEIVRLIHQSSSAQSLSKILHAKICDFLEASRSTLYVVDENNPDGDLRALSAVGITAADVEVKEEVSRSTGVVGYACENGAPVLIHDLRRDLRFSSVESKFSSTGYPTYRTGSCIIIPLRSAGRLVGVLTLADKAGDRTFTGNDFATALELSSTLCLLVDSVQTQSAFSLSKAS